MSYAQSFGQPASASSRLCSTLLLVVSACGGSPPTDSQGTLQPLPGSARVFDVHGRPAGAVPIESLQVDRLTVLPLAEGALAAVHHGRLGGSSVYRVRNNEVTTLFETAPEEPITGMVGHAGGEGLAYVVRKPPAWTGVPGRSALQFRGELWLRDASNTAARASIEDDAARPLGWLGDRLVYTRYLPGDLPEQRPFLLDTATGRSRAIVVEESHAYGFELIGTRLVYAASDDPIVTMPAPNQVVRVVSFDLTERRRDVVAVVRGDLPGSFYARGESQLGYVLEGAGSRRVVDLETGAV
ncbi:MAG: hypothetical protein ACOC1F_08100, partial [Myxococcota bacterium]